MKLEELPVLTIPQEQFLSIFRVELALARQKYPKLYSWPENELDEVYQRMIIAILKGNYSKDSPAIKATCKKLGIKHTYQAISQYLATVIKL